MSQVVVMPQGHVVKYPESEDDWVQITTVPSNILGVLIVADGTNDPTVGVYDGTESSHTLRLPQIDFEADYKGYNGVMLTFRLPCLNGICIYAISDGAFDVSVYYSFYPI